ncbi:MAG: NYN domain-containing protein [Elusimicrobia bacterium]|jgi:predicted RNA-binding protein with PIN domain|nr:NYN domain-containing protein [Elusimicrobiota bacterium]
MIEAWSIPASLGPPFWAVVGRAPGDLMAQFVVDGYNVICQSEALSSGLLRERREKLLRFIEDRQPQGSRSHSVTVVFDGQADVSSPPWTGTTRVLFSPGKDADKLIKDLVDDLANPREAVVVTDDRAIQRWVRGVGAQVLGVQSFLAAGTPAVQPRKADKISRDDIDAINRELWNLWKLK